MRRRLGQENLATCNDPYGVLSERVRQRIAKLTRLFEVKGFVRDKHAPQGLREWAAADEQCQSARQQMCERSQFGAIMADTLVEHAASMTPRTGSAPATVAGQRGLCIVCANNERQFAVCGHCVDAQLCEECIDTMVLDYAQDACPTCKGPMQSPCTWLG